VSESVSQSVKPGQISENKAPYSSGQQTKQWTDAAK